MYFFTLLWIHHRSVNNIYADGQPFFTLYQPNAVVVVELIRCSRLISIVSSHQYISFCTSHLISTSAYISFCIVKNVWAICTHEPYKKQEKLLKCFVLLSVGHVETLILQCATV